MPTTVVDGFEEGMSLHADESFGPDVAVIRARFAGKFVGHPLPSKVKFGEARAFDQLFEVYAGFNTHFFTHEHKVLGRHIARRAGMTGEWALAPAAYR